VSHHGSKAGCGWRHKLEKATEELANERAAVRTLHGYMIGHRETILALESERDALRDRVEELEAALGAALVHPPSVAAERNAYRGALAEIEAVLHRLGTGCTFGHTGGNE
jgi:aminoglycoside phosphotransferase